MKAVCALGLACGLVVSTSAQAQDVVAVGEVHDNPRHHAYQAEVITTLQPAAIVFEMLTPDQAARITPALRSDAAALAAALDWEESGWPDFSYYYPIIAAAPEARIYGADVTRDSARAAMADGVADAFGSDAALFGLTEPLSEPEQKARLALQAEAHCNALPPEQLPAMIDIQRLRDAVMAQTTLAALHDTGGPVAVIAGNGHLRRDWGMPALLGLAAPEVTMQVTGQTEDGAPFDPGLYDSIQDAPAVERPDPCDAFR